METEEKGSISYLLKDLCEELIHLMNSKVVEIIDNNYFQIMLDNIDFYKNPEYSIDKKIL